VDINKTLFVIDFFDARHKNNVAAQNLMFDGLTVVVVVKPAS